MFVYKYGWPDDSMANANDDDLNNHDYFESVNSDCDNDDYSDNSESNDPNTEYNPTWSHLTDGMKNNPFTGKETYAIQSPQTCSQYTSSMFWVILFFRKTFVRYQ